MGSNKIRLSPWMMLSGLLFLSFAACTTREEAPPASEPPAPTVGTLIKPVADVKTRPAQELVWSPAVEAMKLRNYDAVRTGSGSSAEVHFQDRAILSIQENSMVIVLDQAHRDAVKRQSLAMPVGRISGQFESAGGEKEEKVELVIRTPRGWIKARSDDKPKFVASLSPRGGLKVTASQGEVRFATRNREQKVAKNEVLVVAEAPGAAEIKPEEVKSDAFDALPAEDEGAWKVVKAEEAPQAVELPEFKIQQPSNRSAVKGDRVEIRGVLRGKLQAFLNGQEVRADSQGGFSTTVALRAGINRLTFQVFGPGKGEVRYETLEVIRK